MFFIETTVPDAARTRELVFVSATEELSVGLYDYWTCRASTFNYS